MTVNSEIRGTSLSCPLFSCPLLRYLLIKRLAKEWSFPCAILRQISRCASKTSSQAKKPFAGLTPVILTSCMQSSALQWLVNHIKLSFLFTSSATVAKYMSSVVMVLFESTLLHLTCKLFSFDRENLNRARKAWLQMSYQKHSATMASQDCW